METTIKNSNEPAIVGYTVLPGVFTNRFFNEITEPKDKNFELKFGDVIMKDGLVQIIAGWGIYDNQMWTEKIYEDGCHLGAGNYEFVTKDMKLSNIELIEQAKKAYKEAMVDNWTKFLTDHYSREQLDYHLSLF